MTAPADDTRAGLTPPAPYGAGRADAAPAREAAAPAPRERAPHELLVRHALEVSRLTVTRMAEELGIPRATLEAYRLGTRRMPPASRQRLAAYLAKHADMLRLLSQALAAVE
jgi:plasmid maintenance system antidote protein VapI